MSFKKNIVAYLDPLSVQPGETVRVMVSAQVEAYRASLERLICGDSRPHGTGFQSEPMSVNLGGPYDGASHPLVQGSYGILPGLPAVTEPTWVCLFYPTLIKPEPQVLFSNSRWSVATEENQVVLRCGSEQIASESLLGERRWHRLVVTPKELYVERLPAGPHELARSIQRPHQLDLAVPACDWLLACQARGQHHFNGRLENPALYHASLVVQEALQRPVRGQIASWDFAQRLGSDLLVETVAERHGKLFQQPTRGVTGCSWDATVADWRDAPEQYAAVHFHEDDLSDAQWPVAFEFQVPADWSSDVYAVRLVNAADEEDEDYVPFFVRPAGHERSPVTYLASTATYIAYANQRLGLTDGIFGKAKARNANDDYVLRVPEVGLSLYEHHTDGSGVQFSSRLRPVLNLKPKGTMWSFNADSNITAWLHHLGQSFDVVTDEDLHRDGLRALGDTRVIVTGTHPEYFSSEMRAALEQFLAAGGRLMYLGGNGFYWRIAYHPDNPALIEVRRAEDGTRAWIAEPGEYHHAFSGEYGGLWRRLGGSPNELVGVGFAAQGFDGGTYYRLQPDALNPRAAFIFAGVTASEVIGGYGTQGGGAAGEEIDRYDAALGSPPHGLVLASSEQHRPGMLRAKEELYMTTPQLQGEDVRADLVFFETPSGGAVFSVGSISYVGTLSHQGYSNDIARLTKNVLQRFADPEPFDFPGG